MLPSRCRGSNGAGRSWPRRGWELAPHPQPLWLFPTRCVCGAAHAGCSGAAPGDPRRGSAYIPSPALNPTEARSDPPPALSGPRTRAEPSSLGSSPPLREEAALGWESAAPGPVALGEAGTHFRPEAEPTRAAQLGARPAALASGVSPTLVRSSELRSWVLETLGHLPTIPKASGQ